MKNHGGIELVEYEYQADISSVNCENERCLVDVVINEMFSHGPGFHPVDYKVD